MRILRRMSVLASYAKDPAVRPPCPDVPSVQAPPVRALNSDAGGYDHLGVAKKKGKVRRCFFPQSDVAHGQSQEDPG